MEMNLTCQFLISILALSALLIAPGALLLSAIGFRRRGVYSFSPIISLFIYLFESITFSVLGITCSTLTLFFPPLIISVCMFVFSRSNSLKSGSQEKPSNQFSAVFVGYIVFMALVYAFSYYSEISAPDFAIQGYDSVFHYNQVRSFLDTGIFSPLSCSSYSDGDVSPFLGVGGSFYPAAWHLLTALCVDMTGVEVAVAVNAVNAFAIIYIFSTGMYWLLYEIFANAEIYPKSPPYPPPQSPTHPLQLLCPGILLY